MWPLGFWLPTTYSAASPPVAAMLVLMTKVGPYVILRVWLLAFSGASGAAGFGFDLFLLGGMATIAFGAAGMLATDVSGRLAGYASVVSSGILLAVIGYGQPSLVSAGLYYLLGSTLALSAFMLLLELIERIRSPGAAVLAVTMEAFAVEESPGEPVGVGIPAALAFLALSFAACALVITGLPPLSGFVAKFSLFHALLNPPASGVTATAWTLMTLILLSGMAAIIALLRFGVRTFWAAGKVMPPRLPVTEVVPICLLLGLCVLLTVQAGPVMAYLIRTAGDLHQPGRYIERVLSEPAVPGVQGKGEAP
jgi:multicomponent K+:H+ antiporter subunit D